MNRALIRFLGICLAIGTGIIDRVYGDVVNLSGKSGHAHYTGSGIASRINGFAIMTLGMDCTTGSGGMITYCNGYDMQKCNNRYDASDSGSGLSSTFIPGDDNLYCAWYKCMNGVAGDPGYTLKNCSNGYCNTTGVYCESSGFFTHYGYSNFTGTTWHGAPSNKQYNFSGCDSGWYISSTGAPCNGVTVSSNNGMANCCVACPGFIGRVTPTGEFEGSTFANTSDSNCSGGWCWYASGGYGIGTCRAFPVDELTGSDVAGTFTFSMTGCAYTE